MQTHTRLAEPVVYPTRTRPQLLPVLRPFQERLYAGPDRRYCRPVREPTSRRLGRLHVRPLDDSALPTGGPVRRDSATRLEASGALRTALGTVSVLPQPSWHRRSPRRFRPAAASRWRCTWQRCSVPRWPAAPERIPRRGPASAEPTNTRLE